MTRLIYFVFFTKSNHYSLNIVCANKYLEGKSTYQKAHILLNGTKVEEVEDVLVLYYFHAILYACQSISFKPLPWLPSSVRRSHNTLFPNCLNSYSIRNLVQILSSSYIVSSSEYRKFITPDFINSRALLPVWVPREYSLQV